MMVNMVMNGLIAAGVVSAIGYGWLTHLQNRNRRSRGGAGESSGGTDASGTNDGVSLGSWFSSDSSSSSSDAGSCSSGDSGGSDCGGGDGGGGGD